MYWDGSKTVRDHEGRSVFVDDEGGEWVWSDGWRPLVSVGEAVEGPATRRLKELAARMSHDLDKAAQPGGEAMLGMLSVDAGFVKDLRELLAMLVVNDE